MVRIGSRYTRVQYASVHREVSQSHAGWFVGYAHPKLDAYRIYLDSQCTYDTCPRKSVHRLVCTDGRTDLMQEWTLVSAEHADHYS